MNAEEFGVVLNKLRQGIDQAAGLLISHSWNTPLAMLNDVWTVLDTHWQEMEAAEPHGHKCARCDATVHDEHERFCPTCHEHEAPYAKPTTFEHSIFQHSGRLDAIEKRLDRSEAKFNAHMRSLHGVAVITESIEV